LLDFLDEGGKQLIAVRMIPGGPGAGLGAWQVADGQAGCGSL
jgi:hypothetical protein